MVVRLRAAWPPRFGALAASLRDALSEKHGDARWRINTRQAAHILGNRKSKTD